MTANESTITTEVIESAEKTTAEAAAGGPWYLALGEWWSAPQSIASIQGH